MFFVNHFSERNVAIAQDKSRNPGYIPFRVGDKWLARVLIQPSEEFESLSMIYYLIVI
jgi:hypothetical protein